MLLRSTLSHPFIGAILELSASQLLLAAVGVYAVIKFLLVLYRISPLHPLSKVPGPTIAAATWWYRTYYEFWPHEGRMNVAVRKLHAKYGPVVRIGPNEVHFSSPSAYLHIYSHTSKAVKDPYHYHCFDVDLSTFSICDPVAAKERRDEISPFFSRRNILALQPIIDNKLCLFTHQLREIYHADSKTNSVPTDNIVDLTYAMRSFSMDVIMDFCFARTLNILRAPGFQHKLILSTESALGIFWFFKHFPLVKHIMVNLPKRIAEWLTPPNSKSLLMLQKLLSVQVDDFVADPEGMATGVGHEVIYNRLLRIGDHREKQEKDQLLPQFKPEVNKRALYDEAQLLIFAGSDTVGNTLIVGTFHILNTPGVLEKLMEELKTVWPGNPWEGMPPAGEEYIDESAKLPVNWEMLEKLPYLGGVIRESLRMSHGVVSPLQRLAPAQGITIDGWKFPAGTGIASSNSSVHYDPIVFPEPHEFRPERWIGPGGGALEKYLVAFSKGPRICLGVNLAWCELYLAFATLYRRFEFELFETTIEDLNYKDIVVPLYDGRIRARVKPRVE